ncbi:hypothetical protein LC612_42695 [Nostoc sp. CHAB 5834]|nr:hypothetical protein [Nostoc sp. CHAB 5834]
MKDTLSNPTAFKTNMVPAQEADVATTDRTVTGTAATSMIVAAGTHTHTVPLGGSGTALDITPRSLSVNTFIYLGN